MWGIPLCCTCKMKIVNNHQKQLPIQEIIFQQTETVKFSACLRQKQANVTETLPVTFTTTQ